MPENVKHAMELATAPALASLWGIAHYLYKVAKGEKFRAGMFVINIALAAFVGVVIGDLFPVGSAYRDAVISISGFSSFPILAFLEKDWASLIRALVLNAFGLKDVRNDDKTV